MKRYAESKTQDEMGDMQDGVYESATGEYIMVDDLVSWLDKCTDAADIVLQFSDNKAKVEGIIDAYKAVKAHIQG